MKKFAALVIAVFLLSGMVSAAGGKFILSLHGGGLSLAANNFTAQSGKTKVFPEIKMACIVSRNLYIWASHGYFPLRDSWEDWSSKGVFAKDLSVERTLTKRIVSFGCGYLLGYLEQGQFALRAEVGVSNIVNNIHLDSSAIATGRLLNTQKARQSGIGPSGSLSVTYGFFRNIFAEISGGYAYAADTIDGVRDNLGGFQAAVGLGINF